MPAVLSTAAPAREAIRDNSRSDQQRPAPLRILVAEDCVFNQKLVGHLLKKQGHHVEIVADGVQAANAAERGEYDVIIMDIEMPRLDGFAAAGRIRRNERPGARRVPIVALSAHESERIRKRCDAEGFDEVLSKPIDGVRLERAVGAAVGQARLATCINANDVLERVSHDLDELNDLVGLFLETAPKYLDAIRHAIDCGDGESIRQAAHALKGQVRYFCDSRPFEALREMESAGGRGDLRRCDSALRCLEACWPAFVDELHGLTSAELAPAGEVGGNSIS